MRKFLQFIILCLVLNLNVRIGLAQTTEPNSEPGERQTLDLSLREAIADVAGLTSVFPVDLYEGTTQVDYQNWDCRYDLTYSEFRPNYALYLIARNASKQDVLTCFNDFSGLSAKEKVLACAALIAYLRGQAYWKGLAGQSTSASDPYYQPDVTAEERENVLQALRAELENDEVGFSKVEVKDLSVVWEENLRREIYCFALRHPTFDGTELFASADLLASPNPERNESIRKQFYRFDAWNNDTCRLPIKFLCSLMLVNASYDREQLRDVARLSRNDRSVEALKKLELLERDLVVEHYVLGRRSVSEINYERLAPKNSEERALWRKNSYYPFVKTTPLAEGAIMRAYLRTQFIASRRGDCGSTGICGNSSQKDVLVSEIAQKACDWLCKSDSNPGRKND